MPWCLPAHPPFLGGIPGTPLALKECPSVSSARQHCQPSSFLNTGLLGQNYSWSGDTSSPPHMAAASVIDRCLFGCPDSSGAPEFPTVLHRAALQPSDTADGQILCSVWPSRTRNRNNPWTEHAIHVGTWVKTLLLNPKLYLGFTTSSLKSLFCPRIPPRTPYNFHPHASLGSSGLWQCLKLCFCLSLSDLLHSVWSSQSPSMLLQMAFFHSFLWLSNIPLYICTTSFFF